MAYPKWKYHATESARIIYSQDEEMALGEGWAEAPIEHQETYREHMANWQSKAEKKPKPKGKKAE